MPKANVIIASALALLAGAGAAPAAENADWRRYKNEFIQADGRVIDYRQDQSSHSEGQGYAMNLAVVFDDRDMFDSLWRWSRDNLRVRPDGLFAWHWGRRPDGQWTVLDANNATDGDMLIAYALLKAGDRWSAPDHRKSAIEIIEALRKKLHASSRGRHFLLPGEKGFRRRGEYVLNPSYMIFPVMRRFAETEKRAFWDRLVRDGRSLLAESCFGETALPADWVRLKGAEVSVYDGRDPVFGFSAIRVFLYAALEKSPQFAAGAERVLELYRELGYFPAWVNLLDGSRSRTPASAGSYATYGLLAERLGKKELSGRIFAEAAAKFSAEEREYYSASLYLLATCSRDYWN